MKNSVLLVISFGLLEMFLLFSGTTFAQNEGYLHIERQAISFFQINRVRHRLNGVVQIVSLVDDKSGKSLRSRRYSFSGTISGHDISITFADFLSQSTITGTYSTSSLNLSMPAQDGRIVIVTYKRANISQFNKAVSTLRIATARINAQIGYQRYAAKLNQDISEKLENVATQVQSLRNTKEFDTSAFEKNLKEMLEVRTSFLISLRQNDLADAKYEFSRLQFSKSSVVFERKSLNYSFQESKNLIKDSKSSLQDLNLIFDEYWVALAKDGTGLIRRDIDRKLFAAVSRAVGLAVREVENLMASADSKAVEIESQTNNIISDAKKSLEEAEKRPN